MLSFQILSWCTAICLSFAHPVGYYPRYARGTFDACHANSNYRRSPHTVVVWRKKIKEEIASSALSIGGATCILNQKFITRVCLFRVVLAGDRSQGTGEQKFTRNPLESSHIPQIIWLRSMVIDDLWMPYQHHNGSPMGNYIFWSSSLQERNPARSKRRWHVT